MKKNNLTRQILATERTIRILENVEKKPLNYALYKRKKSREFPGTTNIIEIY